MGQVVPVVMPALTNGWSGGQGGHGGVAGQVEAQAVRAAVAVAVAKAGGVMARPLAIPLVGVVLVAPELAVLGAMAAVKQGTVVLAAGGAGGAGGDGGAGAKVLKGVLSGASGSRGGTAAPVARGHRGGTGGDAGVARGSGLDSLAGSGGKRWYRRSCWDTGRRWCRFAGRPTSEAPRSWRQGIVAMLVQSVPVVQVVGWVW